MQLRSDQLTLSKYEFGGYNGKRRAKLTWPLVLVSLTLSSAERYQYLEKSLCLHIESHYMKPPSNVRLSRSHCHQPLMVPVMQFCHVGIVMSEDTPSSSVERMKACLNFIEGSLRSNVPANTFMLIDTHSTRLGGMLQYGGDAGELIAPTQDALEKFCGRKTLDKMQQAAATARQFPVPGPGKWYNDSPQTRGGWRCLLLSTCSLAMQVPGSFDDIRRLVVK